MLGDELILGDQKRASLSRQETRTYFRFRWVRRRGVSFHACNSFREKDAIGIRQHGNGSCEWQQVRTGGPPRSVQQLVYDVMCV